MLWFKAFHLIFMVAWFAGLFYLPRLFVYHAQTEDQLGRERFKRMESRLYYAIMAPAALLTLISGLCLLSDRPGYYLHARWFLLKLLFVLLLIGFHCYCGKLRAGFQRDNNQHSSLYYRFLNEVPTLLLIAIIGLAIIRPG